MRTSIILGVCFLFGIGGTVVLDRLREANGHEPGPAVPPWGMASPGSPSTDFPLLDVGKNQTISLKDIRGKMPTVLIFGSFGCDIFCGELGLLKKFFRDYREKANFAFVYVREQDHKIPELERAFQKAKLLGKTAENQLQRIRIAMKVFDLPFPCLFDESYQVGMSYGMPIMGIALLGADGKVQRRSTLHEGWDQTASTWLEGLPKVR